MASNPHRAFVYLRRMQEQMVLVALNFSARPARESLTQDVTGKSWRLLFSTVRDDLPRFSTDSLELAPFEVCLLVTP